MSIERRTQELLKSVTENLSGDAKPAPAAAPAAPVARPRALGPAGGTAVGGLVGAGNQNVKERLANLEAALERANTDLASSNARVRELESRQSTGASESKGGIIVKLIDPNRVRHSELADRSSKAFTGPVFDEFCELIRSTNGNEVAGAVRPITGDPDYDFDIIFGHRRHAACKRTGKMFKAEIKTVDDGDLLNLMMIENKGHLPLSAFERGLSYARALERGLFVSGRALSQQLNIKHAVMQRLLQYPFLPQAALDAFPDPREIREYWVAPLIEADKKNPEAFDAEAKRLVDEAAKSNAVISAKTVFHRLIGRREGHKVIAAGDKVVGSIRSFNGRPGIVLAKGTPDELLQKIAALVVEWTQTHGDEST